MGNESYCLSEEKNVTIGNFTSIAGGCVFHGDDNHAWIQNKKFVSTFPFDKFGLDYPKSSGGIVEIGNDVWIGESSRIMSGVKVGDGAMVAAGSVVTKDVPPFAMVAGNPARIKYFRFNKGIIKKLLNIKWWNWDLGLIKERIEDFKDINKLIKKYK